MTNEASNFIAEGSIATLAPTVARLFVAAIPTLASEPHIESVLEVNNSVACGEPIEGSK
ncbi:hypothetical protein [Desulfosarcina variabilis]|uniref:hypothetical protein n=1 Tax=Desulfosarcina variabilis TaxID=2300 RepID=UPI003AFACBAC